MSQVDQSGSKDLVASSPEFPHHGHKKKSFLERMKEREERQSKVKMSPSNVRTQFYNKPSSRDRGPIDNLRTSPAIKKIIKEEFNREKVNYCFLPETQIQLQMIQKFKGHVDSLKKRNILSKKGGDANLENHSSEEETEKSGSSLGFIPISDYLPKSSETAKNVRKCNLRVDRKSEKCVKFLFPSEDDSDDPKMKVRKTPVKPILRLAKNDKVQVTPVKSLVEVVNITDSQTTPIKSLEAYRDELEQGTSGKRFETMFDARSKQPLENASGMLLVSPSKMTTEQRFAKLVDSSNNRMKEYDDKTLMNDEIDECEGNVHSEPTKSKIQSSKHLTSVTEIRVVGSPLNAENISLFNRQNKIVEMTAGNDLNSKLCTARFQVESCFSPEKPPMKLRESHNFSLPLPLPILVFPDEPVKLSEEVDGDVIPSDHVPVTKLSEEVNSEADLNCSVDMFSDVEDAIDSSFERSSKDNDKLSKMDLDINFDNEVGSIKPLTGGTEITVVGSSLNTDSSTLLSRKENLGSSKELNSQKCQAKFRVDDCLSPELPQGSLSSETFSGGEEVDKIEMALVTSQDEDGEVINDKNNLEQISTYNDELLRDNMINEKAILEQIMAIDILTADLGSSDDILSDVNANKNVIHYSGEPIEAVGYEAKLSPVVVQETLRDVESLSHEDFGGSPEEVNENEVPSLKKKEKMKFEVISSGMSSSGHSQKSSQPDQDISVVFSNREETSKKSTDGFLCDLFSDVEEAIEKATEDDDETEDEENYKIF